MFLGRRRRSGPDRFLVVKLATLIVGGVLGLVGMRAGNSWLVGIAIGVVLVGFLLRFLPQREHSESSEPTGDH
ncbi:MAG: hypothetical protein HY599_02500 [Candidatus Omnitrophica bacterium]|nr:hypothetical protein [Candidatus Omnitrophota bacterium]